MYIIVYILFAIFPFLSSIMLTLILDSYFKNKEGKTIKIKRRFNLIIKTKNFNQVKVNQISVVALVNQLVCYFVLVIYLVLGVVLYSVNQTDFSKELICFLYGFCVINIILIIIFYIKTMINERK